jgi:hypothetical protein
MVPFAVIVILGSTFVQVLYVADKVEVLEVPRLTEVA